MAKRKSLARSEARDNIDGYVQLIQEMGERRRAFRKKYPEHVKLERIAGSAETIATFLEWMQRNRIHLCLPFYETENGREQLLAKYFKINLKRLEKEKQQMLEEQRAANKETKNG
jgi:hypothetical protein